MVDAARSSGARRAIAVYGATGYTGANVARALAARGRSVVLAGRDARKLAALARDIDGDVRVRPAAIDDPAALRSLAGEVGALINCAGPFAKTAAPVAYAAIDTGAHYLDVSGEGPSVRGFFEHADRRARDARVVVLPAFAFFSALSDMLVALTVASMGAADVDGSDVAIVYAIDGWRPSAATFRSRIEGLGAGDVAHDGGVRTARGWPPTAWFDFPAPLGRRRVSDYPTGDPIVVSRHVRASRVTVQVTASTLAPAWLGGALPFVANSAGWLLGTPARPLVESILRAVWGAHDESAMTSDPTTFRVVVRVSSRGRERVAELSGRGIYDVTAPIVSEAATRLVDEPGARPFGALAPSQAFEPRAFLDGLAPHGLRVSLDAPGRARAATAAPTADLTSRR